MYRAEGVVEKEEKLSVELDEWDGQGGTFMETACANGLVEKWETEFDILQDKSHQKKGKENNWQADM